ncbi:MAG: recombinase family protein [Clostridiaceae bacterium]
MKQCYYKQEIHGRRYHQHKSDRSEFQRLIADCNAGLIDMVIIKSLSRFSRNTVDTLNILRELKQKGVDVFFERENIHGSSGDGELILTILSSFLQEESRSVSENCDGYSKEDGTGGRSLDCVLCTGTSYVAKKYRSGPIRMEQFEF